MSTTIVIFGASGDLTWRKLIPGLYNNFIKGRLDECSNIVGYARRPYTDASFRERLKDGVTTFSSESFDAAKWEEFSALLLYFQGNLDVPDDFTRLQAYLKDHEEPGSNRLYYLATAPEHYIPVVTALGAAGMADQSNGWRNIIIEKPFGHDLESARQLNRAVHAVFDESQVYRIDHYLGKETAQNISFFRFANTIFEPVWNRRYVDHVQITVAETVDIGHRADYYDGVGVLRDMFQNHLLQLLSLVAMEPPASFEADAVRNEIFKLLSSVRPAALTDTVRAQYEGYCDAEGVAEHSQTPTFAAIKLFIDNWRWQGVPFYLRSGKALAAKSSQIIIVFQRPPHLMFHLPDDSQFTPNILSLFIQPDEGIHLKFQAKVPGSDQEMSAVEMDFRYSDSFSGTLPDAYERLLQEALDSDASLFTRSDCIEAAWKLIDPIVQGWEAQDVPKLTSYTSGTWGPEESDKLLGRDGRVWRSA
ncbi:MAG: glucose-6-phosphate dehydrogenase [Chloroflexi bacterium RBG_16_58_14]|nr:MAG: glucose-6-phosphate dehydrogenase [Chloroflexi bacterium RBG_16_58_14]